MPVKEIFEKDKILFPEILNHYVKNNKGYHCYFKFNEKYLLHPLKYII